MVKANPYQIIQQRVATFVAALFSMYLYGCECTSEQQKLTSVINSYVFDESSLNSSLQEFTRAEHPMGSDRQIALSKWIASEIRSLGEVPVIQPFKVKTPNPVVWKNPGAPADAFLNVTGNNVYTTVKGAKDCLIVLGSHYDTKKLQSGPNVGANDSGSSSAAMFQAISFLKKNSKYFCDVVAIWFDGEEAVLPEWTDGEKYPPGPIQDNTYGSRFFTKQLQKTGESYFLPRNKKRIIGTVIIDMIGSKNLSISRDLNSTPKFRDFLDRAAKDLNLTDKISRRRQRIEDDHIPFLKLGIPSLNIIDFNNTAHWHTENDTLDKLDNREIFNTLRLTMHVLWQIGDHEVK